MDAHDPDPVNAGSKHSTRGDGPKASMTETLDRPHRFICGPRPSYRETEET